MQMPLIMAKIQTEACLQRSNSGQPEFSCAYPACRLPPAPRGRPLCALDRTACLMHSLHVLPPLQSFHRLLLRWCSQKADPPQSLHVLRMRWCTLISDPPQSLHRFQMRWCSQKADPPQSLHLLRMRPAAILALAPLALVYAQFRPAAILAPASPQMVLAQLLLLARSLHPPCRSAAVTSALAGRLSPAC